MAEKVDANGKKQQAAAPDLTFEQRMAAWFAANSKRLNNLWGSEEEAKRFFLVVLNVVNRTPKLLDCDFDSLMRCLLQSSELKVYPGPYEECAYVPRRNGRAGGRWEANFELMYKGLVKLAYNAGMKKIDSEVVYAKDRFVFQKGVEDDLVHVPTLEADRGDPIAVWALAKTAAGESQFVVWPYAKVLRHRSRSAAFSGGDSPWKHADDWEWMAKKTLVKQVLKLVPKSSEVLVQALQDDDETERTIELDANAFKFATQPAKEAAGDQDEQPAKPEPKPDPQPKQLEHQERPSIDLSQAQPRQKQEVKQEEELQWTDAPRPSSRPEPSVVIQAKTDVQSTLAQMRERAARMQQKGERQ